MRAWIMTAAIGSIINAVIWLLILVDSANKGQGGGVAVTALLLGALSALAASMLFKFWRSYGPLPVVGVVGPSSYAFVSLDFLFEPSFLRVGRLFFQRKRSGNVQDFQRKFRGNS